MPDLSSDIFLWSILQPVWQRDALRRLFTTGDLSPSDIDELVEICEGEHGLAPKKLADTLKAEHIRARGVGNANPVSLVLLTHHDGVNALAQEQTISFGPHLTVVYGQNAAGKSGYTRILKQACRSRNVEDILGNVLGSGAPLSGTATIRLREGTTEVDHAWDVSAAASPLLSQVSVFDSHCVPVYLREKTDVAFRPFDLDVFDKLASACFDVKKRLDLSLNALRTVSLQPLIGVRAGTRVRQLLDSLSALTKEQTVSSLATLSMAEEQQLTNLRNLVRDLQSNDPKKRALELSAKATRFDSLATHLKSIESRLGLSAVREFLDSRSRLHLARAGLNELLLKTLTPDLLPDSGNSAWRTLWDAAEGFVPASTEATPEWLAEHSKCPLCQQSIGGEASSRLAKLHAFAHSTAQEQLRRAEAEFRSRLGAIQQTTVGGQTIDDTLAELQVEHPSYGPRIEEYCEALRDVRDSVLAAGDSDKQLSGKTVDTGIETAIRTVVQELRDRATQLQGTASALTQAQQQEWDDLESRVVLRNNRDAVLKEIERKIKLAAYSQCIDDTSTSALTKKSTELTKLLVTDQLRLTFQAEVKGLEFKHLSVEIQPAGGSRGELFHKLAFTNAPGVKVTDVLSEGESRTLSLGAFLTELSTAPAKSGIIFDDPVSSLDHVWRERIGRRLVTVAKERQVIIFTHDLVFLKILTSEAESQAVPIQHQYIRREGQAGVCSADMPWVAMNVRARLGVLRKRWQAAEALFRASGLAIYEPVARDLFGLLREAWEDAISEVLLNDVIERYRPSIETKRVAPLHDIQEADCRAVNEGMTACSRWIRGHSEAAADGSPFPEPAELKERIDDLDNWVAAIRKRRN